MTTNLKTCSRCLIPKEPTTDFFRRRRGSHDGLAAVCKVCVLDRERKGYEVRNTIVREKWAEDTSFRESRKKSSRDWKVANEETLKEYRRNYYADNAEKIKEDVRRFRDEFPEKSNAINRAGSAVHRAIKSGLVSRPDNCSWCDRADLVIDAAHHDYNLPLDFLWLCRSCHSSWDREMPKLDDVSIDIVCEYFYGN